MIMVDSTVCVARAGSETMLPVEQARQDGA